MRRLLWPVALASVVVACGGSVSSGGASSSGASGSSGSTGSSGSSGGGSCSKTDVEATRVCVPATAAANRSIELQIDDVQGCLPCFTTVDRCSVAVSGNVITLGMSGTQCTPKDDVGCATVCGIPSAKCTLPPLTPGKYTVAIAGEGDRTGFVPRELLVTDDSTETSCTLTVPVDGSLEGTRYGTSCSNDDDCRMATFGNLCQPCACPNAAIAKNASDEYEAGARAAVSQCPGDKGGIVCAACPPVKARCEIKPEALTGTCTATSS